ncbi:MAG: TlyA family RNA methyltransferase [Zoogloeaceae bacterium]|jgi:23S rRNA (cytidine1920-2'-O)/16S rRNA (cytidine1409-2'-O)-methyltransferase|nr:TlyA family RNA methyltransferase [Zoogloeaceae bacterium]
MAMNSFHARTTRRRAPPSSAARPADTADTTNTASAADAHGMARADLLLVRQGLAQSRTEAQAFIKAGRARWPGGVVAKPAQELPMDTRLALTETDTPHYVSRGALKLAGALAASGLSPAGWICLDVGQSTGGFTDCLLTAGAARVVGVDVGHGQLHPRLEDDERVACFEGINCRALSAADLGGEMPAAGFDLIVADVSFISLTLILPRLPALLAAQGHMLLLVKPQFEAGPGQVGKKGIVRDPRRHLATEEKLRHCCADLSLTVHGWFPSAIAGGDGNREFFLWTRHAA